MKIGIIGLPQVGKKTLFELLTGESLSDQAFSDNKEIKIGVAKIHDARFDKLVDLYNPKKSVPSSIDVVLLPKFDKETVSSGEFLKSLEKCDALCHIVRAFGDESVFHVDGSVDPMRDMEKVTTELILSDLILVEKRIERIALETKKGVSNPNQAKEKEILANMKELLDKNLPLSGFKLSDEKKKIMSTYQFLTRKPMIIVLNVDEDRLTDHDLIDKVSEKYKEYGVKVMQASAKIEAELASLEPQERETFLKELNIQESALNQLSALCFEALGRISFFTVGHNEVHAWTAKRGSLAPQAAGNIHTDMERGFIRAEIMKCTDLIEMGSEAKLKETGKLMVKGKDYALEDGDIMHVRFNV
jgi:ribosome-binding ATPase